MASTDSLVALADAAERATDKLKWSLSTSSIPPHAGIPTEPRSSKETRSRRLSQVLGLPRDGPSPVAGDASSPIHVAGRRSSGEEAFHNVRRRLFSFGSNSQGESPARAGAATPPVDASPMSAQSPRSKSKTRARAPSTSHDRVRQMGRSISIAGTSPTLLHTPLGTSPPVTSNPPSAYRGLSAAAAEEAATAGSAVFKKLAMRPEAMPSLIAYMQVTKEKCSKHLDALAAFLDATAAQPEVENRTIRSPRAPALDLPADSNATVKLKPLARHATPFPALPST